MLTTSNQRDETVLQPMLNIVALIRPKPELYEVCRERLQGILVSTRAEAECYRFELYEQAAEHTLVLVEQFKDDAALAWHYEQDYVREVFDFYQSALRAEPEIHKLQAVSSI